ncbi:MAG: DEAD/DEAH box helicase [Sumerlaeia bacterium]
MTMTFRDLAPRGLGPAMIAALEADFGASEPALTPLQQAVLEQTAALPQAGSRPEDLLLHAPTGSGKTLVAELAALGAIARARSVLYLVPTRALAEQKAREFTRRYAPCGIRVAVTTRERREDDGAILRGEIHWIVAVYEKALAFIARRPSLFSSLGLIAADEVQLLADRERGGAIDLFLTRWSLAKTRPQLLAFSAVLGDPEGLADWLGVRLFSFHQRPVPLREGVLNLDSGDFFWRDAESGAEGTEEDLIPPRADMKVTSDAEATLEALVEVALKAGPLLAFCSSRPEALRLAQNAASANAFPPAEGALAELAGLPGGWARDRFQTLLESGVAFHTSDLEAPYRDLVERAFQAGEIPFLAATPTLSEGVNLRAATVVSSATMPTTDPLTGSTVLAPIARARLTNQGGRAGRLGKGAPPFGRSILLARDDLQATSLWRGVILSQPEPERSPLADLPFVNALAELMFERTALSFADAYGFLRGTFGGRARVPGNLDAQLREDLEGGLRLGFWRLDRQGGPYRLTALGEALALTGICPQTATRWAGWLERANRPSTPVACLFLISLAEEWGNGPPRVEAAERRADVWPTSLRERLHQADGLSRALGELFEAEGGAPFVHHRAARRALILDDLLTGEDPADIERLHALPMGRLFGTASHGAWLASAAVEFTAAVQGPVALSDQFCDLAHRLEAIAFRRPAPQAATSRGAAPGAVAAPDPASRHPAPRPQVRLEFPPGQAGTFLFDGVRYELTPIPYALLLALARRAGEVVRYIDLMVDVWGNVIVEQQQMNYHRRVIGERTGNRELVNLIKTRSRWGMILELSPSQVSVPPEEAADATAAS